MHNFSVRFYHSDFIVLCFSGFTYKSFIVAPEVWFLLDAGKICKKKWGKKGKDEAQGEEMKPLS